MAEYRQIRAARAAAVVAAMAAVAAGGASMFACGFVGLGELPGAMDGAAGASGDGAIAKGGGDLDANPNVLVDASSSLDAATEATTDADADAARTFPASCAEIPSAANTDVTLHVGHDPAKPWNAHCGAAGETYLRLPAGAANNFSSYPENGCASKASGAASAVTTTWTRVRIDPVSLIVTTNDYAGATSTGSTHEVSGNGSIDYTYVKMPFATGRTCDDQAPERLVAKVDLTGTSFRIAANQFINEGFQVSASASTTNGVTMITATAFPGGIHSCRPAGTDYYQRNGGSCLQLEYVL